MIAQADNTGFIANKSVLFWKYLKDNISLVL